MKEILQPEILGGLLGLTQIAVGALGMALSEKQRRSVRNRDGNKCNFPAEHDCRGQLQVHHILPQRYSGVVGVDPDFAENLITICRNSHVGPDGIHPDIAEALQNYRVDPKAMERVQQQREELLTNREIYWEDRWDRMLSAIAVRNTQRKQFKLPEKNGKKNGKG